MDYVKKTSDGTLLRGSIKQKNPVLSHEDYDAADRALQSHKPRRGVAEAIASARKEGFDEAVDHMWRLWARYGFAIDATKVQP